MYIYFCFRRVRIRKLTSLSYWWHHTVEPPGPRYPSAHIWGLRLAVGSSRLLFFVFFHPLTSILAEKLSSKLRFFKNTIRLSISKRVLKSRLSSQTWDCDVLGCNKPCGKSRPSGAWSSRTNVNLKPQTWREGPGQVTSWLSRFSPEMLKNLNLKISIVLILSLVTDASYKSPNLGPSTWLSCARYFPFCRLHLLFSPFPAIMHTKHEKAKQLTGKQHFIYSLLRHTVLDRSLTRSFPVVQK